ncbi:hypothetical protein DY000_02053236 [Brassica cretica]|uniref:Uncharacterized protein n=1 Tax=Brassica cretica TaxID=69181 RepID=A0ABQ7AE25_BRACR|nr:hypothetical protein DY000_02053236 [Brassica cretica]
MDILLLHSSSGGTYVTKLKLGKLPCIPLVSEARPRSSLDNEGAVWIRSCHSWKDGKCVIVQKGEDHHMWEKNKKPMCMKLGTSCKKGRLRKLFRAKRAKGKYQKRRECSYSAYMDNSVEERMVVRGQETKEADDPITKKE